ncbi:hypothetical protein BCV69DRAFT_301888 [Microstroma glucosiphilum]|uniref:Uncharacterized protein n=1 Tax=Pseudomicrostroma glucosiphilum TaxID=1684307 RepID=A0A316U060_9BASI|nr:hypothetical protein BCV69DRAFT_301888 [Pseudomicrostroma glucosiphilum]PWN17883.1 hypothetical protein BCV69DRAFT_301888 [Pseudomicrostroma glucosiphilum]
MRLTQAFVVLALTLHAVSAVPVHVPFEGIAERDYQNGPSDEYQTRSTNAGNDGDSSEGRRDVYLLRSAPTTVDASLWSRGLDPVEEEDEADRRDLSEAEEDEEARDSDDADEAAVERGGLWRSFRTRKRRKQLRKMGKGIAMGGATLASTALMDPAMLMDMAGGGAASEGMGMGMGMMRRFNQGESAQAQGDAFEERSFDSNEDGDLDGRDFDEDDESETRDFNEDDGLDARARHRMFGRKWRLKRKMKRNKGKIGLAAGGVGLLSAGAAYQGLAGGGGLSDAFMSPAALSPAAMDPAMGKGGPAGPGGPVPAGPGGPGPADPAMLPARSLEAAEADADIFEGRDLDFDTGYALRDLEDAPTSHTDLDKRGSRHGSGRFSGRFDKSFGSSFGSGRRSRSRSRSRNSGSFGNIRSSLSSLSSSFGRTKKKSFLQRHGKKLAFGTAAVAGLGLTGMALQKSQAAAAGGVGAGPTDPAAGGVDPAAAGVDPATMDPSMMDPATGMAPRSLEYGDFDERDFADLDSDLVDERDEADDSFEERGDDEDSFDERDLLEDEDVYERSPPKMSEKEPILILL